MLNNVTVKSLIILTLSLLIGLLVLSLVRPGEQDPQQRLWQALDTAAAAYDAPADVRAFAHV